jgi:hypothetical protein
MAALLRSMYEFLDGTPQGLDGVIVNPLWVQELTSHLIENLGNDDFSVDAKVAVRSPLTPSRWIGPGRVGPGAFSYIARFRTKSIASV